MWTADSLSQAKGATGKSIPQAHFIQVRFGDLPGVQDEPAPSSYLWRTPSLLYSLAEV